MPPCTFPPPLPCLIPALNKRSDTVGEIAWGFRTGVEPFAGTPVLSILRPIDRRREFADSIHCSPRPGHLRRGRCPRTASPRIASRLALGCPRGDHGAVTAVTDGGQTRPPPSPHPEPHPGF